MSVLEATKRRLVPVSVFQLFSIGIGPSSSHTVGPMRAALQFAKTLEEKGLLRHYVGVSVELFGSLAMTGKGHATDKAVLLGLEGESPEDTNPDDVDRRIASIEEKRELNILGKQRIAFVVKDHLIFHKGKRFT